MYVSYLLFPTMPLRAHLYAKPIKSRGPRMLRMQRQANSQRNHDSSSIPPSPQHTSLSPLLLTILRLLRYSTQHTQQLARGDKPDDKKEGKTVIVPHVQTTQASLAADLQHRNSRCLTDTVSAGNLHGLFFNASTKRLHKTTMAVVHKTGALSFAMFQAMIPHPDTPLLSKMGSPLILLSSKSTRSDISSRPCTAKSKTCSHVASLMASFATPCSANGYLSAPLPHLSAHTHPPFASRKAWHHQSMCFAAVVPP